MKMRGRWAALVAVGLASLGLLPPMAPSAWAEATSDCPLVYLPVAASVPSSYDDTPDWAPPQDPMAPFDGNFETRWATLAGVDNQSIQIDLGKPKRLSAITIHWERAYAPEYELLTSDDAQSWKRLALLTEQDGGIDEIPVPDTTARYVKLVGLKRFHQDWGFSIWEMELYGCQAANPDDKPIAEVFPGQERPEARELVLEDPVASPGPVTPEEFQRGMVFLSFHEHQLFSDESDAMLDELAKMHVGHVALVVTWYQEMLDSDKIFAESPQGGRTPVDEAVIHAINKMHALGMKVMLKPHVDVQAGDFRGDIAGSETWFASYKEFIVKYAELAKQYHVELYCVGTELAGTTYSKYDAAWRDVINAVRDAYPGPIMYGANWDEYKGVPFWDAVDYIGIDAYFPLTETNDPTGEQLIAGWTRWADEIEAWRKKKALRAPVIFTEVGYSSFDGVNRTPWEWVTGASRTEDKQEQKDCLEAMLTVMTKRDWFRGLYYWNWFSQDIPNPLGYVIRGKPAGELLSAWYERMAVSVAPSQAPKVAEVSPAVQAPVAAAAPATPPPAPPVPAPAPKAPSGPVKMLFGFEKDLQGWTIPDWALEKPDMVAKEVRPVAEGATEGKQALGVVVDFPGGRWNGALAEVEEYFDWTPYRALSVDVTLPADAPAGLKAKLILTVGEEWEWTEMRRSIQLTAGQTTTLTASLAPGSEDWKRTGVTDAFRKDVRKLAIRLESNKPAFNGLFSIDNVRLE